MALGGESERLGELKVQQLRSKRKRMEGSTDETVEGDILEPKPQTVAGS